MMFFVIVSVPIAYANKYPVNYIHVVVIQDSVVVPSVRIPIEQ